jgi:hypothetical protein
LRQGIPGASLDGEAEEEQSEEEQKPGSCGAYFRVHDEYDEGRVEDAIDRDEGNFRRGWVIESGVQHGQVRANCAIAAGVVLSGGRKGSRGRTNGPKSRKTKPGQSFLGSTKSPQCAFDGFKFLKMRLSVSKRGY